MILPDINNECPKYTIMCDDPAWKDLGVVKSQRLCVRLKIGEKEPTTDALKLEYRMKHCPITKMDLKKAPARSPSNS